MNGKDIFLGLRHIDDDIIEEAEFGTFPIKQLHRTIRRPLLVAAVIALTLLLVGCAVVYVLCMQDLKVGQQEVVEFVYEVDPDTKQVVDDLVQKPVTKQVLTLAGLKGTPNYQAAREWFDFKQNYVPQGEILKFPEEYASYSISTQEMKDKLDGILQKYDLKLIGKTLPFTTEEQVCRPWDWKPSPSRRQRQTWWWIMLHIRNAEISTWILTSCFRQPVKSLPWRPNAISTICTRKLLRRVPSRSARSIPGKNGTIPLLPEQRF